MPVCPTWSVCGRQPALVTAREQPTAPPSSSASSSITAKPSAEPTPRPPETTTSASASDTPARRGRDALGHLDRVVGRRRRLDSTSGVARRRPRPRAARPSASSGEPWTRASSSRLPPQRTRVTVAGSPGVTDMQFAAIGRSSTRGDVREHLVAALGPGASTALGARSAIASASAAAQPPGRSRRLVDRRPRARHRRARARTSAPAAESSSAGSSTNTRTHRHSTPELAEHADHRGRGVGAVAEHLDLLARSRRQREPDHLEARVGPLRGRASSSGLRLARSRPGTDG